MIEDTDTYKMLKKDSTDKKKIKLKAIPKMTTKKTK